MSIENLNNYLGNWIQNISNLSKIFLENDPFPNIVIDNFLNTEIANELCNKFPTNYENWHKYENPLEYKLAFDNIENMDKCFQNYFKNLYSNDFLKIINIITNSNNLEADPFLHGAGLHCHPKFGRLNIHLDYESHPKLHNKERKINIIYFLNKDWNELWNGANELWDKSVTKCIKETNIKFNRAIIFQTNDISWHGLPKPILCPKNIYRKSIAIYYIANAEEKSNDEKNKKFGNDGTGKRTKASYIASPYSKKEDKCKIDQLIEIRPKRRIEKEDMEKIWPDWNPENDLVLTTEF